MPGPEERRRDHRRGLAAAAALLLLLLAWLLLRGTPAPPPLDTGTGAPPAPAGRETSPPPPGGTPESPPGEGPVAARPILVLDPEGRPAPGAALSLVSSGMESDPPLPFGATGPDGRAPWPEGTFPLPGLLRAEKEGCAPGEAAVATPGAEAVLRLGTPFVLEGIVVARADGSPVAGAEIRFEYVRHDSPLGSLVAACAPFLAAARSGPDGSFRLPSLAVPMSGLLSVRARGFAASRRSWPAGGERRIRVELERPLSLRVRLLGRDGTPLPGGAVALGWDPRTLHWKEGRFTFSWTPLLDLGDGTYGTEGLAPGWFLLAGAHEGHAPRATGWIGLREGAPPVEIRLDPAAGLEGRVVDDGSGEPLAGARLRVMDLLPGEDLQRTSTEQTVAAGAALGGAVETRSGPDGSFRLGMAAPGKSLLLFAEADGYWPLQVDLSKATSPALEVRMKRLATTTLRGRAVDEAGNGIAGAMVRWEGVLGSPPGAAAAEGDGRFLVPGLSDLQAPALMAPGRFPVGLSSPSSFPGGDCGDVVLPLRREIRGRVVDADGTPVPGLTVAVFGGGSPARQAGRPILPMVAASDGGGFLAVPVLGPGEVLLRPTQGADWTGSLDLAPGDPEPFTLVVTRLPGGGTGIVHGRAMDQAGDPVPARLAAMVWAEGAEHPVEGVQPGFAAPDGTFSIEKVPAGTFKVQVWGGDWIGETRGVVVAEGGTADVVVTCGPLPKADPSRRTTDLRVAPAGTAARALTGWATEGDKRSRPLRVKGEELVASLPGDGLRTLWLFDLAAGTAAVVPSVSTGDAQPVGVSLSPAGRIVLQPREDGRERWVVVRGPDGSIPWSNLETSLPGVPGEGYVLLLPPGEYEVTLSLGIARRDPEVRRMTAK